jgi:AraC family transcriptional regulator, regulatory protein of adaptative response / DNA-3-methyladenine glycosylase II
VSPFTLVDADGVPRPSAVPGTLGGHGRSKVYGRLDCGGALSWIARGKYAEHRVFFADEATAIAAGFRPCGGCLRARYREWQAGAMTVRLRAPRPFDARHLVAFTAARAVPGLEEAGFAGPPRGEEGAASPPAGFYRRAGFALEIDEGGGTVSVEGDIAGGVRRARAMLDLRADPAAIEAALGEDPLLPRRPGMRSPGVYDAYETAIRAIVGQQISVAATRTILGRLHAEGLYPDRDALAAADPAALPMPLGRARALIEVARGRPLGEVKGVGPWTRDYVRMRTGDPDVLLATDLVVRRALGLDAAEIARRGEAWRPFRSYATHRLWSAPG